MTNLTIKPTFRYGVVTAGLVVLLGGLILLNINMGSVSIPSEELWQLLFGGSGNKMYSDILWKIRLPRMLACILLGGALALSGFLLQTFFHNPIAGPYILGISSGAKLMVALLLVVVLGRGGSVGSTAMIGAAFLGAMLAMSFVLLLSRYVHHAATLILGGIMIGYICSAITDFVVAFADDASIVNLHNWSHGSFSGISWENIKVMALVVLIASFIVFFMSKQIGAYQLGEAYAKSVGLNLKGFRVALVLLSSLLAACVTAFAGPISFVGIAVPHLARALLNTSKPLVVIPVSFLGGAIFCLGCDLIARTLFAPMEVNISAVTSIFGAPIVIYMVVRRRLPQR